MDELDKIAYQKLYDMIQTHNQNIEKNAEEQLKALKSIRSTVSFFGFLVVLYIVFTIISIFI